MILPSRLRSGNIGTFLLLCCASFALQSCKEKPPGQRLYGFNCAICHHNGSGQVGEFPPLVGRLNVIARTPEGQAFLAAVMINGLNGPITAQGEHYNFAMPPFKHMSDDDLTLVLNWLIHRASTHAEPNLSPEIFARARQEKIGSVGVHHMRSRLQDRGLIP